MGCVLLAVVAVVAGASAGGGASPARYGVVDLGTLGGDSSVALAINASGVVVGTSRLAGGDRTHAFVYERGSMRDLGSLPGLPDSAATAVDPAGVVTGRAWVEGREGAEGPARSFRSTARGLEPLSGAAARRALLPAAGSPLELGLPAGADGQVRGRNGAGELVGDFYVPAAGERHAFLWRRGAAVDLNDLLRPGSGWVLQQATGIDDAGEIVGVGTHDGRTRAFLLEPGGRTTDDARATARAVPPAVPARPAARRPARAAAASRSTRAADATDPAVAIVRENPSVYLEAVDADGNAYGTATGGSGTDLLRSSDEGATWSFVHSFPSGSTLWHIAALSSGTLLAAVDTGSWTIWRSADHGDTWTKVLTLPTAPVYYRTLTPHSIADGGGYVWLGTYNNGSGALTNYIYRSPDDGRTWTIANTTSTHKHIHGVRYDDANGRLYVLFGDTTGDGIWQSADLGNTLTPLCTTYACIAVDMAFDPVGSFGVFGQDHYKSTRSIMRIDLATGALTTLAPLPYSSFSAERVGGTYLIGTTRETGEPTTDPNLHLFASNDGSRFVDAYQKPFAYPSGIENLRVQFAFPNGDFPIQVGGYGTIVGRVGASSLAPPANVSAPTVSGAARVGSTLTASPGTWTNTPTFAYQWQRCDIGGAACADTTGATAATYTPVAGDVGHALRVVVTGTNAAGSASATSDATAAVTTPSATAVLVVVAHPDDEALGFAGVIETAVAQGRPVYVAVVTNGDGSASGSDSGWCGAAAGAPAAAAHAGIVRDGETLSAMRLLGLRRTALLESTQVLFLGYPDGALQTIVASNTPLTGDATGLHRTYADDGDTSTASCNGDLHYLATGAHAPLDASDLSGDLDRVLALTHPADVYTHAAFDGHPDHAAVNRLVLDAIARAGTSPVVHTTLIHPSGTGSCLALSAYLWPNPADTTEKDPFSRLTPTLDVTAPPTPPCSSTPTGSSWGSAGAPDELVAVPADMRSTDPATNRKWQAISRYASQISCVPYADGTYPASCGYMRAFVKAEEFFWTSQPAPTGAPVNVAAPGISGTPRAGSTLTGSSGTWSGAPTSYAYEWRRCDGGGAGCVPVAGATGTTYLLGADDVGHAMRLAVTATNASGQSTAVSEATAAVAAASADTTTFGQSVVGTLVDTGGANYLDVSGPYAVSAPVIITRLDGYVAGGASVSHLRAVVYRDNGGQPGTLVAVSNEATVAAGAAPGWVPLTLPSPTTVDAGGYWLGYWYADGYGRHYYVDDAGSERYRSAAYSATGSPLAAFGAASSASSRYSLVAVVTAATVSAPVNTAPPTVTGSAVQGQPLTATAGTWSGGATGYSDAWQRCDASGNACAAIAGATDPSYTLGVADVGSTIRVAVTASNSAGSATATSAATPVVTAAAPAASAFGESTVGTLVDRGATGYLDVSGPYQLTVSGTASRLNAYLAGGTVASHVRAVIYADSGGQPATLVAVSAELETAAAAPAGWTALVLTAPVVLPPGSYWIGYWYADGNGRHSYLDRAGSERYRVAPYSATADPPASFGAASSSTSAYSLTVTYTAP